MSCFDIHAPNGGYHTEMVRSGGFSNTTGSGRVSLFLEGQDTS